MPSYHLGGGIGPEQVPSVLDLLRQAKEAAAPAETTPPSLAALARQAGRGGVEQTGQPRTFTGSGLIQVEGDPSGKYWFDPQQQKWRVTAELPPGYIIKPPK